MQRRRFSREFKIEAVKLVRERGVSVAQAGRDLGVHENVLRKWVKEFGSDPVQTAFDALCQQVSPDTPCAVSPVAGKEACLHLLAYCLVALGSCAG